MNRQIRELELETTKLDVWKDIRKFIEAAAEKLGVTLDLQTKTTENAIKQAKAYKEQLEAEKKRLKEIENAVRYADLFSKAAEETNAIAEASIKLEQAKSKYITGQQKAKERGLKISLGEENSTETIYINESETLAIAQKQYELQKQILDTREEELSRMQELATQNKDLATLEAVRSERAKSRVASTEAELKLIQAIRLEQKTQLGGSQAGRQALQNATERKARVDKQAAFKTEESAVLARQKSENAQRMARGERTPLSMQNIRDRMAEEAVGLRTPPIQTNNLQMPGATPNGLTGGIKAEITPVRSATALPTSGQPVTPAEVTSKPTASLDSLLKAFNDLASTLKQAPLVTSAA
jgi:hypothetical protein